MVRPMSRPTSTFGLLKHVVRLRWQKTSGLTKVALLVGGFAIASALTLRLALGGCCACHVDAPADSVSQAATTPAEIRLPEESERR